MTNKRTFNSIMIVCMLFLVLINGQNPYSIDVQANVKPIDYSTWFLDTLGTISTFSDDNSNDVKMAVDSKGNIHTVWQDNDDYGGAGSDSDIWYRKFTISTETWGTSVLVSEESSAVASITAAITIDTLDNIHVLWQNEDDLPGDTDTNWDIYHRMWNNTENWSDIELVTTDSTDDAEHIDAMCDNENNLHIVWEDHTSNLQGSGGDWDIFYTNYTYGTGWDSTYTLISEGSSSYSYQPKITTDPNNNLHVVWYDQTDNYVGSSGTDVDIPYRKWDSSLETWGSVEMISTESTGSSLIPEITSDSEGNVFVGWHDATNWNDAGTDYDIFFKYWDSTYKKWSSTQVVSEKSMDTGNSYVVDLVVDASNQVHFCWEDHDNYFDLDNNYDCWYRYYNPQNNQWSATYEISETSTDNIYDPKIIMGGDGFVYFAWEDKTDYGDSGADQDIKYRRFVGAPESPELATIVPNPSTTGNISLTWETSFGAKQYYLYRDTSYIFSTTGLIPLTTTDLLTYEDTALENGTYYYAVVADNNVTTSELSNVEYVTVNIPAETPDLPDAPSLAPFVHEVNTDGSIKLDWNDVHTANKYYIYRETSYFWDTTGITPIANTTTANYTDTITEDGIYYYGVVAENTEGKSKISNVEAIEVQIIDEESTEGNWNFPKELLIVGGGLLGVQILSTIIILLVRKK